jgi:pyruvate-formate lyase-activating enzyme/glutaredoxin
LSNELYTTTGCARCKITKRYMRENSIDYAEFDFKAKGKDAFSQFYRANRDDIFRDKDGVAFPVFTDGKEIRQGVSVILGYLIAKGKLDGFINRSMLHGEWIDGFDISNGNPAQVEQLMEVLSFLKSSSLKIQVTTSGANASVLEKIMNNNLCDRVIMEVKGPADLYHQLAGQNLDAEELQQSIKITSLAPEYHFYTIIAPLEREDNQIEYLTPEEIGETAKIIEVATRSKKHPYELRHFNPKNSTDDRFKNIERLASPSLFKYRTAARRYMVMTEIEK